MVEDRLLVWRCRHGSRDALCRIYEKYKNNLLALAVSLSNDVSLGEDVVHDVFVSFAQAAARLEIRGSLKSYLSTCVANRVGKLKRAESLRINGQVGADVVRRQSSRPDQLAMSDEVLCRVGDALAQLPYEQREVILLHLHSGLTFREIAGSQETSMNTVQSRYRYGLQKLRSKLNSEK
ncbi:MAG: sigma-70 family RNA polymerase sigma factor [Phycisphaerales bacterium]|nr:MAG: sigma-70 family RNA polymerase sigma factor [Phycisphaerales bacterium]